MTHPVRIFLSSPGDVAEERALARDLLLGLARGPFVRGRVHIDVVSWDDPYAPAPMDARLTPQQAVDRGLPTPSACDLTVVLLWSRMGTPLAETKADGTPYRSGTEWELENALAAGKPVFIYRRSEKVLLDPDAPDFDARLAQKRAVDAFFAGFVGAGGEIRRAYSTYDAPERLLGRLRQDVEHVLRDRLDGGDSSPAGKTGAGKGEGAGARTPPTPDVPAAYRAWVKKQHGGVDLLGLQLKKGRPPSLSAIYVPQTTTDPSAVEAELGFGRRDRRRAAIDPDDDPRLQARYTLALDRLATESLYVSGAPGTGKSTLCRWVAWLVAEGAMPSADVPAPEALTETLGDGLKGRLPVLIRLRELGELLPPRAAATAGDLEDAIAAWLDRHRPDGLDAAQLRAHLAHGSALVVLDGVDEVPVNGTAPPVPSWRPRHQLLAALADACQRWIAAGNRVLLTSRPYGLAGEEAMRLGLAPAPLQPLPRPLQDLLAERWFAALAGEAAAGAEMAAELFANIDAQPWLVELAANPLLLTAMCIVFDEGKRLPQDKHELYERVVATVLFSRYPTPAEIDQVKRELGVIAYGMHTGGVIDDPRSTPRSEATFHEVEGWLREYRQAKDYTDRSEATVFAAREALLSHSGLFLPLESDRAGFAHLSFQEFFAAQRHFTEREADLETLFLERAATPEWRNTLSFLFGRLVGAFLEPKRAITLVEALLDRATTVGGLALVLADAAEVLTGKGIALRPDSMARLQRVLLEAMTGSAPLLVRAEVGSALGRIGDPRFRADRFWLPDEALLGFIEIPAGPFPMGSDPCKDRCAADDEKPQHDVDLPDYFVARYSVTVAQFRAFVEDSGFHIGDPDALRGRPNHPVVWVSFGEARAYCEWLTGKLSQAPWTPAALRERFADGWVVTLPSEAGWEKAARGTDARLYPWGNAFDPSKANGAGSGLFEVSTVGLFPEGASPSGCHDMAGNVWEWTRSRGHRGQGTSVNRYGKYPYGPADPERDNLDVPAATPRVLRGGSYNSTENSLRAAFRDSDYPNARHGYVGFRLVSSRCL